MDKRQSLINVGVSLFFKIILLILIFLTRRFLIIYVGNEANGLLSLYTSIIGFLAIADLGIGTAITFCMYKPIVDNDMPKVAALYKLFIKFYTIIGTFILISGLCLTPFLKYIAKDSTNFNLYSTFIIMLVSIVLNYMYSAKTSVINAYKNNYITTTFRSICLIVEGITQLIVLYIYRSFELFLIAKVFAVLVEWLLTSIYFRKHHKELTQINSKLDTNTKKEVSQKTKAMFMHKIGTLLVNSLDSIIISTFIGVIILGKYTNYTLVVTSMNGIIMLFFTPLTSIIGHLCVKEDVNLQKHYYNFFFGLNYILGVIFYLGYYAVVDDFILLFFGPNLFLDKTIILVITINYFVQFMRTSNLIFRDATGTFYNDRYKPLIEGVTNLILSLILVKFMGITGVILATIITNLVICHIVEPYVLFKHAFNLSPKNNLIINYFTIIVFIVMLFIVNFVNIEMTNALYSFFVNGSIAVLLSLIPIFIMFIINKDFKKEFINLSNVLFLKLKSKLIKKDNK